VRPTTTTTRTTTRKTTRRTTTTTTTTHSHPPQSTTTTTHSHPPQSTTTTTQSHLPQPTSTLPPKSSITDHTSSSLAHISPTALSTENTHKAPVVAIVGATLGVILIMTLVAIWAFIRRRKSHPSKTSPSISPKGRDLEQQLNLHNVDKQNHTSKSIRHSLYSLRKTDTRNSEKHNNVQHHSRTSSNVTNNTFTTTTAPAMPQTRDPIPPRISSSGKAPSIHSIPDEHSTKSQKKHRRQPSVHSITNPSAPVTGAPPVPPLPTPSKPVVQENQPTDCHIDMVTVNLESLMPIIISEELQVQQSNNTQIQSQQTPKQQDQHNDVNNTKVNAPVVSSAPHPRRPTLPSRKSADAIRTFASFPPPPPPPSVPPPAVPMTYPGGMEGSTQHINNTRGRRPRASMESLCNNPTGTRRSISLDSTIREELSEDEPRSKTNSVQASKRIILPPTSPPPVMAVAKQQVPVQARRQHQKSPSQILNTGFFVTPERSPLSPLSPPHSPLTIQIPRNMPPRSNSAQSTYPNSPANFQNRPDSPTTGSDNTSPSSLSNPQQLTGPPKTKAQLHAHNKRIRVKSNNQVDPQRVFVPSIGLGFGPRSPPAPTQLSDHLPPHPSVHSHLANIRRPSLTLQQQQWMLHQQSMSSGWEDSSRPSTTTPTGRTSFSTTVKDDDESLNRRSTSFDSWTQYSYPTSPATPPTHESMTGGEYRFSVNSDRDFDLQSIIANARRIVAGKNAALEEARRSGLFNYHHQGHQQRQPGSRPWTPSDENYQVRKPSFDNGFESEASYYMKATRATPPSRG
ncbi:hypothetical protein BGZ46_003668, partial [Entomortierella lignicola]